MSFFFFLNGSLKGSQLPKPLKLPAELSYCLGGGHGSFVSTCVPDS